MPLNDADRIADSANPDQTAPLSETFCLNFAVSINIDVINIIHFNLHFLSKVVKFLITDTGGIIVP